ncbi:hypothetical protein NEHOM01_1283 [Nematocida homosporus]|uniref:uncharacterized protein n=1 Tax=Nematocida homosporus TaxID=1912981 RepID=UPI0022200747|nr:uncharacterized protein NEHOM01_1283 [Nematocida homosporus]KAI5186101.1 hypothetical protein NEHOM01_1283 [Nematocida homosporus]
MKKILIKHDDLQSTHRMEAAAIATPIIFGLSAATIISVLVSAGIVCFKKMVDTDLPMANLGLTCIVGVFAIISFAAVFFIESGWSLFDCYQNTKTSRAVLWIGTIITVIIASFLTSLFIYLQLIHKIDFDLIYILKTVFLLGAVLLSMVVGIWHNITFKGRLGKNALAIRYLLLGGLVVLGLLAMGCIHYEKSIYGRSFVVDYISDWLLKYFDGIAAFLSNSL